MRRLLVFFLCMVFLYGGLLLRLGHLKLVRGPVFAYAAFKQQVILLPLEEYPRGSVCDRYGVSLTGEHWEERIAIFPVLIRDKEKLATDLGAILGVAPETIAARIGEEPVCLSYRLTAGQAAAIRKAGFSGVAVVPYRERYGPRPLATHVVGHLGRILSVREYRKLIRSGKFYAFDDYVGRKGCEYYYEYFLKGTVPCAAAGVYRDARGKVLKGFGIRVQKFVDPGRADLVLTIDRRAQQVLETVLDARVSRGAAVVLAAGQGDILAVASRPSFTPAHLLDEATGSESSFVDRAFAPYPPGSVFKILVAAAALEKGVVKPESRFGCRGSLDPFVPCWQRAGHGTLTLARAFAVSCNPVFAQVGLTLGKSRLLSYYHRCDFTERWVVGYPVPRDPRQDVSRYLHPHNLINQSVGQGPLLVTPVQVAALVNTLVNNGVYVRPRLVKGFRWRGGAEELPPDRGKRVFSPATAAQVCQMMALSVAEGTGWRGGAEGWRCGGKTGTAETGNKNKIAWFAGYAPAEKPRYVVVVMVENGASGATAAGPVFKEIVESLLSQENLPRAASSLPAKMVK